MGKALHCHLFLSLLSSKYKIDVLLEIVNCYTYSQVLKCIWSISKPWSIVLVGRSRTKKSRRKPRDKNYLYPIHWVCSWYNNYKNINEVGDNQLRQMYWCLNILLALIVIKWISINMSRPESITVTFDAVAIIQRFGNALIH